MGNADARIWTLAASVLALLLVAAAPAAAGARVLRVGSFRGNPGNFNSIQSAVDASHEGDWILIGPGDHHPRADFSQLHHAPADGSGAGVVINTDRLHLRGMDRNRVIVDGTKPGSARTSSLPARVSMRVCSTSWTW